MTMKLGTNLFIVEASQPFLNVIKAGDGWYPSASGVVVDEFVGLYQNYLDANGYPTTLTPSAPWTFDTVGFVCLGSLGSLISGGSSGLYDAGVYVFLFDGLGTSSTFEFTRDASSVDYTNVASGRILVTVATPTTLGIGVNVHRTGFGSGANYPKNFRLVYSPDSAAGVGGSTTAGVSGTGTREALLNSGEIFNPHWLSLHTPFNTVRFLDWMTQANINEVWADRRPQGYVFYTDCRTSAVSHGMSPKHGTDGVPYEVQVALCNKLGANGYFQMPVLSDDDYRYNAAALILANLNSPLVAYVEDGNEYWNMKFEVNPGYVITGSINSSGVLAVTAINSYSPQGGPGIIIRKGHMLMDDWYTFTNIPANTFIRSQLTSTESGGALGGRGTYQTSRTGITVASQSITTSFDVGAWNARLALDAFPTLTALSNSTLNEVYSRLRSTSCANLCKAAWAGNTARLKTVFGGFSAFDAYNQNQLTETGTNNSGPTASFTGSISGTTLDVTSATGTIAYRQVIPTSGVLAATYIQEQLTGTAGGIGTYRVNRSQTVTSRAMTSIYWSNMIRDNVDVLVTAPYFGSGQLTVLPPAWANDYTTGSAKAFTELNSGGEFPTTDGGRTTGGTGSAFTLTTGHSWSGSEPPDMSATSATFHTTIAVGATLKVDGSANAYPLVDGFGNAFTSTVAPGAYALFFDGVANTWAVLNLGYSGGILKEPADWLAANVATANSSSYGNGLPVVLYEFGNSFVPSSSMASKQRQFYFDVMRDTRMGTAHASYLNALSAQGATLGNHYSDIGAWSNFGLWGSLESFTASSSPRYDALVAFAAAQSGSNSVMPLRFRLHG